MDAHTRHMAGAIRGRGRVGGFTYVGLMIVIAIMGVMLAATGEVWLTAQQREKERELLFVGDQFRQALDGYYEHTPGQGLRYPLKLEELLKDTRHPATRRYLRRIYRDPVTGSEEWGLVKGANGEILGVHSLSEAAPLKQGNFVLADRGFEGKTKYAEWVFMHVPGQGRPGPAQQP